MLTASLALLFAQSPNTPPTVTLALLAKAAPHATVKATVTVTFAEGLHGYQNPPSSPDTIPVKVTLKKGDAKLVTVKYPKGTDLRMAGDPKPAKVYSGTVKIPVIFKAGTKSGPVVISFEYQQCTEAACFPPASVEAKATLLIKK